MTDTPLPATENRDELRAKIEASERRIAERTLADQAKEAADSAVEYTRKHPLTVIGGAIGLGLLIGLATPPGRRAARSAAARTADVFDSAAGRTADFAREAPAEVSRVGNLVSNAILAFGMKLIDSATNTAQAGQDAFEDLSASAADRAREIRRDVAYKAGSATDKGMSVTRRTRRKAERAARDIKGRLAN